MAAKKARRRRKRKTGAPPATTAEPSEANPEPSSGIGEHEGDRTQELDIDEEDDLDEAAREVEEAEDAADHDADEPEEGEDAADGDAVDLDEDDDDEPDKGHQGIDALAALTAAEIAGFVAELDGWELEVADSRLVRDFSFKDFAEAKDFMTKVWAIADAMDHHPEIYNVYNQVSLALTTHDVNGISIKDFHFAKRVNAVL